MIGPKAFRPRVLRSTLTVLLILLAIVSLIAAMPLQAAPSAAAVQPTLTPPQSNPKCDDYGLLEASYRENPGSTDFTVNSVVYTLSWASTTQGTMSSWTSTYPILLVILKGSDQANLYSYPSGSLGDTNLVTPTNSQGNLSGISHVSFCYVVVQPTSTPTATNTATATATNTATATATSTGTPANTPTNTPTTTGTPANTATPTNTPTATPPPSEPGPTNTPTATPTSPPNDNPPADNPPTSTPVPPTSTPVPPTATPVPPTPTVAPVIAVLPVAEASPAPVLVQLPATGLGGSLPIDPPIAGFTIAMLAAIRLALSVRGGRRDD